MKPCELTQKNWDINVAVFPDFDLRVTADARRMWFRVSVSNAFADVDIPVKDFKKAIDFVRCFDMNTLTDDNPTAGLRLGTYSVEIMDRIGRFVKGKWVYKKTHPVLLFAPLSKRKNHSIALRLSLFKKITRWYNTDFE